MQLSLAINYGGRAELVDAVKAMVEDARCGDGDSTKRPFRRVSIPPACPIRIC